MTISKLTSITIGSMVVVVVLMVAYTNIAGAKPNEIASDRESMLQISEAKPLTQTCCSGNRLQIKIRSSCLIMILHQMSL